MGDASKWIPLPWLVKDFSVAELATTIEEHGIYCIDGFGRRVKAHEKSKDEKDFKSAEYALCRLEGIYSDQVDPGPDDPYADEFDRSDEDPLLLLGWPEDACPLINFKSNLPPKYDLSKNWLELAVEIAEDIYRSNMTKSNVKGKLDDYADLVHKEFVKYNIKASHGEIPSPGYIKREALQGDRWWKHKK